MATSPFFSGRIPQELYDKAEEHCKENKKKKTDLLIEALSIYLGIPIATQTISFSAQSPEVTKQMFESLQEQVNRLEELVTQIQQNTISIDNTDNNIDNSNIKSENTESNIIEDNNEINNIKTNIVPENKNNKLEDPEIKDDEQNIKIDDNKSLEFKSITTSEAIEKINFTRRQFDNLRNKAIEKAKNQSLIIKPGELLKEPVEVFHKNGIIMGNKNYRLFYMGENSKGKPIWNLIPDDNKIYQQVITEVISPNHELDNSNYHFDNNNLNPDQNTVEVVATELPIE